MKYLAISALVLLSTSCITFENTEVQAPIPSYSIVPTSAEYIKFDSASGRTWALMGDHWVEFPNKVADTKFELIKNKTPDALAHLLAKSKHQFYL